MQSQVLTQLLLGLGGGLLTPTDNGSFGAALSQGLLGGADAAASAQAALPNPMDQKIKRAQLRSYRSEAQTATRSAAQQRRLASQVPTLLNKMKATPGQRLAAKTALATGDTAGLMDIIAPEAATPTAGQRELQTALNSVPPAQRPAVMAAWREKKTGYEAPGAGGGGGLLGDTEFSELPESAQLAILTGKQPMTPGFTKSLLSFENDGTGAGTTELVEVQTPQGVVQMPVNQALKQFGGRIPSPTEAADSTDALTASNLVEVQTPQGVVQMPIERANQMFPNGIPAPAETQQPETATLVDVQTPQGVVQMPQAQALKQFPKGIPSPTDAEQADSATLVDVQTPRGVVQMPQAQALKRYPEGIPSPTDEEQADKANLVDVQLPSGKLVQMTQAAALKQFKGKIPQPVEAALAGGSAGGMTLSTDPRTGQTTFAIAPSAPATATPTTGSAMTTAQPSGVAGTDAAGNPIVMDPGGPTNPNLGTVATNAAEETISQTENAISRLRSIKDKFDPSYQTLAGRADNLWHAGLEKIGVPLDKEDKRSLTKFTDFKRYASENINTTIRDITGAALTEGEAGRIVAQTANPGTGLFDGDSPTQFMSKVNSQLESLHAAQRRAQYLRTLGYASINPELARQHPLEEFMQEQGAIPAGAPAQAAPEAQAQPIPPATPQPQAPAMDIMAPPQPAPNAQAAPLAAPPPEQGGGGLLDSLFGGATSGPSRAPAAAAPEQIQPPPPPPGTGAEQLSDEDILRGLGM